MTATPQQLAALDNIRAAAQAVLEQEAVVRASLVDPAPNPPPPSPTALVNEPLNLARVVCIDTWHGASRYERFQRLVVWKGISATVRIIGINLASGGGVNVLGNTRYTLEIDGVEAAAVYVSSGSTAAVFTFQLDGLAEGWRMLRIGGLADGESCPTWFAYVDKGGARPVLMPVCTGSYDVTHNGSGVHSWTWVPSISAPLPRLLTPRAYPPVTASTPLRGINLVPGDGGNINRPCVNKDGIRSTFNAQSYNWNTWLVRQHLLDGPRGVGTASVVMHISIGTGRVEDKPDSPLMGNIYACEPLRLTRISDAGNVTTLVGWRHKEAPGYWQDKPASQLELVGDWSAVPEARRGCFELWGLAWDADTLTVNAAAEPIPDEQGRRPHIGNPVCFITDSVMNRVLRVEFDGKSHRTPAKVTEWLTTADPWDVVAWRDEIIVSERGLHRIAAYSKNGPLKRVIVERNPALPGSASVDSNRFVVRSGSIADLRAHPCIAPEGLYVLDDWLYFGSFAQAIVRRIHLVTGEMEDVCQPTIDGNSRYIKIAVSDGTVFERGSVFVDSWSNNYTARSDKVYYRPDGTKVALPNLHPWSVGGYGTAVAVGAGRLYVATSEEGITRISARLPTDAAVNAAAFSRGAAEYAKRNLRLLHGPHGYGHWDWDLPADSADIVAYLKGTGAWLS
jgi:hypothetical protein